MNTGRQDRDARTPGLALSAAREGWRFERILGVALWALFAAVLLWLGTSGKA
ncbi:MAG: hypothetical protein H6828_05670 [Planctomycetes bacterium]|nr:hypothetical protein [Planctomycetota bacterium]